MAHKMGVLHHIVFASSPAVCFLHERSFRHSTHGLTQEELYASRIIELHGALIDVVNREGRDVLREANLKRLDDALSQRRASVVP